jgi:DNA-binding GntR family transcriptional regulator
MNSFSIIEKEFNLQYSAPLVEQVMEFLSNAIIQGRLKGGERLIENELQRRLGISRASIRECFRILERNGLVTIVPRKGTFVRKISPKDVEENFPIRAELEGLSTRLAILNLTSEDIEKMESVFWRMTAAFRDHDFESYSKSHSEFHQIIYRASKNETLIKILDNLRLQANWFGLTYLYIFRESFEYAINAHREILDVLVKKDSDRAETLMKEHILIIGDKFIHFLESEGVEGNAVR